MGRLPVGRRDFPSGRLDVVNNPVESFGLIVPIDPLRGPRGSTPDRQFRHRAFAAGLGVLFLMATAVFVVSEAKTSNF